MIREIKVDFKDWKTRKIKTHGMWILVGNKVDLHDLVIGTVNKVEVSQLMDGRYIIEEVIKNED